VEPPEGSPPVAVDQDPDAPPIVGGTELPDGSKLSWVRAGACADGSPMSLTASDGTGLRLGKIAARAVVEGPLAFTELELEFHNPEPRVLEGRFSITLPPDAALSRFAMQIDGAWQEGEVVERTKAQQVYEDFLHRRQDPALLEADAGNVFQARVFPIPASGTKTIVVSYSQELRHTGEPYRLPLCGLPQLETLDVDVAIARLGASAGVAPVDHLTMHETAFSPTMDLEAHAGIRADGVRSGDLAIVRVAPVLDTDPQPLDGLTILFDTSASRALDFGGQVDRLGRLVSEIARRHPDMALKVAAYDQSVAHVYTGPAKSFGDAELNALRDRGALGASDLEAALAGLAASGLVSPRVLLVGDGVVTSGATDAAALKGKLRDLSEAGMRRFDAIVDGGIQDAALLRQLVRGAAAADGVLLDTRIELAAVVDRLERATRSGIAVKVPGAEWVWPRTLDAVQPGDEVLVYAQLPPEAAVTVQLEGAGVETPSPTLARVAAPLLSRAHAQARIAGLDAELSELGDAPQDTARRADLRRQIVELSTRHRVLSDYTALLVLETEDDYARYGIARNGLADVLTVGPQGIEATRREGLHARVVEQGDVPLPAAEAKNDAKDKDEGGAPEKTLAFLGGDAEDAEPSADAPRPGDGLAQAAPAAPSEIAGIPEPESDERPALRRHAGEEGRMGRPVHRSPPSPIEDRERSAGSTTTEKPRVADPWDGRFATVMSALGRGQIDAARREAVAWRKDAPGDVLALVALGETSEAAGDREAAARAYGSLVDLFPSRADIRRMAGERLERLERDGLALAIDTYEKALEQRPDQPSGARLLAYALVKDGKHEEAFAVLETALARSYPSGRFAEVHRILSEDLGLVGAAWVASDPSVHKKVESALRLRGATLPTTPSTRFVLNWETDANDVDLHVFDKKGGHAFYSSRALGSGGELYADVTTGFGPECFAIQGTPTAGPYVLQAHYYRRGPMGYGMGKLQVIEHDGKGGLAFGEHPFAIMKDDAFVDLATVEPGRTP
jgi:tetratricopeptide (TPR) repeat protein